MPEWVVRCGRLRNGRRTEICKDVFEIRLCDPSVLVVVDELEGLLELLYLLGLEEREDARDLASSAVAGARGGREVVGVFGHGRG